MAFDGEIMSPKNRAIGKAALTKAALTTLERLISEGIEDAHEAGIPTVADRLETAQKAVSVAHRKLHDVALALSAAFDEGPEAFSGGDDKPPPPPEG